MKVLTALTIALIGLAAQAHLFANYQREEAMDQVISTEVGIGNVCQVQKDLCDFELKQKQLNRRISAYKNKGGVLIR